MYGPIRPKFNHTISKGKQCIVVSARHVTARLKTRPPLPNNDASSAHHLAAVGLHTQPLRI